MADDKKTPGGARNVDDLKARLGIPRKAATPAVAVPAGPSPAEAAAGATTAPGPVAPPPAAPAYTPPDDYAQAEPTPRPTALGAPAPAVHAAPAPAAAPLYVEEPPPPRSLWQRYGRPAGVALAIAAAGGVVGYMTGKGAAIRAGYGKVKEDAVKLGAMVKEAYAKVDEVAGLLDPSYAAARKGGQEPGALRAIARKQVDWASLEGLEKYEPPKDLEAVFDSDYKRFNRATVKALVGFVVDLSRMGQQLREHSVTTKAARAQLDAEASQGSGPRNFGVIAQALPNLERGEVVLVRARRPVKQGTEETFVYDVAKRSAPTQPIAVPEANLLPLSAPGLLKTSGSLLAEYNRRNRDLTDTLRRLLETRPRLQGALDQIVAQIKD